VYLFKYFFAGAAPNSVFESILAESQFASMSRHLLCCLLLS